MRRAIQTGERNMEGAGSNVRGLTSVIKSPFLTWVQTHDGMHPIIGRVSAASSCYSDRSIHIDTHFSRVWGKPPTMVAGMTPTPVQVGFVSAIMSNLPVVVTATCLCSPKQGSRDIVEDP